MNIEQKAINTLRFLSVDQVNKANSGHPGAPMGAAPIAYTLFKKIMNHNPKNPNFQNRDRFILSIGHASALLYSVLCLTGYDFSIEDLITKISIYDGLIVRSATKVTKELHEIDSFEVRCRLKPGLIPSPFALAVNHTDYSR